MIVDLRSDTLTKPGPGMLEAMFSARVGDDVYGEDETVNALEEKLADMFGKQAALFCPSGTMSNQIAIKCLTSPMDEVICDALSHVYLYEAAGMAFNSSVSVRTIEGDRGRLTAGQVEEAINPIDIHHPRTSLVVVENTSNRGGGSYYTLDEIEPLYHLCQLKKLSLHLDGARIFNALTESGEDAKDYGHFFDTISVCLSKGLGAPAGSVLLGSVELIARAKRIRKVLGGAMRQVGYLAAAGIYALDHNIGQLKQDHAHARFIAGALKELPVVQELMPVDTNIIIGKLRSDVSAENFVDRLDRHGIKSAVFGPNLFRMVTHLDISPEMVDYTLQQLWQDHHFHHA